LAQLLLRLRKPRPTLTDPEKNLVATVRSPFPREDAPHISLRFAGDRPRYCA